MAYRRDDIERVRAATDLVELAAEVTKVKRSGRSTMAVCPFHQEKTPSLSIDPGRGLYHCFGCGKSGDLFRWVQETQGLDFHESVEFLARRAGIPLQRDPDALKRQSKREAMISATRAAVDFYRSRLQSAGDAGGARAYVRSRGYGAETVEGFHIGYSPPGWDVLVRHLKDSGVKEDVLVGSGVAVRGKSGRLVDRFRGRLMFPVFDVRGDPVGFGARLLEGDGPKYLNSPETPLYHKARLLYGLNWSKSEIVRTGHAVVVEGYTDVIGMHEAGMPVAVATCGTALGEDHLKLLLRFTERVVLAFDADAAGSQASQRGFEHSVPGEMDLRAAILPEGRDPADLVSEGDLDVLTRAVDDSEPLMQFMIDRELSRFDLTEPEARARAVRAAALLVARHPDNVARHEYGVFLARRTGVDLDVVTRAVEGAVVDRVGPDRPPPPERLTGEEKAERELLRLYLANEPGIRDLAAAADWFTRDEHAEAFELIAPAVAALAPGEPPDLGSLIGGLESELGELLRRLAMSERPLADPADLARKVQVGALDRRIREVRRLLEAIDADEAPEEYSDRFQELIALERRRRDEGVPA